MLMKLIGKIPPTYFSQLLHTYCSIFFYSLNQLRTSPRSVTRSESFQRSPNRQPPFYARRFFYKNEKTLTRISVYIVWMFLGSHVWKIGPNIYEVFHMDESSKWPRWMDYFCLVSHLMLVANSSLNFLMYLIL